MSSAPAFKRAQRSQEDASARVSKLFERHGRMVYGVCRAMLRNEHEAEDATQQAFLSAYRALLGGAEVRDGGAWMATIARNECRARIAASMRTPLPVSYENLASLPAPGDEAERRLHLETLRSALAELPERQREAVVLRYLYGLRYGEVATALGLSRPATEALLFRARRALRHSLRPAVTSTIVVPVAVQEALAQAIPGFAAAGSGAALAGAAGGGLLAKLTAAPIGAKVATVAVAATTVGTIGAVESERAGRDRAVRAAIVTTVSSDADELSESSVRGLASREDDGSAVRSGGERGRVGEAEDSSGPGSSGDGDSSRGERDDASSSGPGPTARDPSDDDRSGPGGGSTSGSGSGSDDPVTTDQSGPSVSSGSGSEDDSISALSGSGQGSSGSSTSGSGSGEGSGVSGTGSGGAGSSEDGFGDSAASGLGSDGSGSSSSGSGSGSGDGPDGE